MSQKYDRHHQNFNGKLKVFDRDRSKKVSLGDANNGRQPEMAAETGNTCIPENTRDCIEILAANPGFSTISSSNVVEDPRFSARILTFSVIVLEIIAFPVWR